MARSVKNAKLVFGGLVNFEVQLFSAARDEASGLKNVHTHADGTVCNVGKQDFCFACKTAVPYAQLQKGVELDKGTFAVVDTEALKACTAPECTKIEIEKFVPMTQVDPVFFDASFFLAAKFDKKSDGRVPYELLYQSMKTKGLAGVATVTIKGKMHNVFIRVYENGLMLHTIFNSSEIRSVVEFTAQRNVVVSDKQIAICAMLIDTLVGDFDAKGVTNQYDDKKDAVIAEAKAKAVGATTADGEPVPANDVMAQMMASIEKITGKKPATVVEIDTQQKVA